MINGVVLKLIALAATASSMQVPHSNPGSSSADEAATAVAVPSQCTLAYDPKKCAAAWSITWERRSTLGQCIRKAGARIASSAKTLDDKFVAYTGACGHERARCVTAAMAAQMAGSPDKEPSNRLQRFEVAMSNARNRCDDMFEMLAGRSIGVGAIRH